MSPYDRYQSRNSNDEESQRLMEKSVTDSSESLPQQQYARVVTAKRVYITLLHGVVLALLALQLNTQEAPLSFSTKGRSWCEYLTERVKRCSLIEL